MTRMQSQKQSFIRSALKDVQALKHLTSNSSEAQAAEAALLALQGVL